MKKNYKQGVATPPTPPIFLLWLQGSSSNGDFSSDLAPKNHTTSPMDLCAQAL